MKKVLIHSIVFNPDGVSTAYLYNDIAIGLKAKGFDVVVLTTTPHYNIVESDILRFPLFKKCFGLFYTSDFNQIKVYHLPLKKYKGVVLRILSFIYWHLYSFIFALFIGKVKFVISPSPPLTIGFISNLIAKIKGAKSIYNVQELYPDLLINKGLKSKIFILLFRKLEKNIYHNASAVTTISTDFFNKLISRIDNKNKLNFIPNFVDTELYKPLNEIQNIPLIFNKEKDQFVLMYAGNIGYYQDWEPIIYAASALKNENVEFWIIGEGVQKEFLKEEVFKNNLNNIRVFPYQKRELMPELINYADLHFISIKKEMEEDGFPSKVYTLMACAKPMIIIAGKKSPLYNFLADKESAVLITENRNSNFVHAILKLKKEKDYRLSLGINGLNYIKKEHTKDAVINKYAELINSLDS